MRYLSVCDTNICGTNAGEDNVSHRPALFQGTADCVTDKTPPWPSRSVDNASRELFVIFSLLTKEATDDCNVDCFKCQSTHRVVFVAKKRLYSIFPSLGDICVHKWCRQFLYKRAGSCNVIKESAVYLSGTTPYEVLAAAITGDDPWPHAAEAERALGFLDDYNPCGNEEHQKENLENVKRLHEKLDKLREDLCEYERKEAAEKATKEKSTTGQPSSFGEVEAAEEVKSEDEEEEEDKGGRQTTLH
ncbi:hypothetical protein JOL62DRAFT_609208 [Phyllosticta paracitricarpa]|uniref:Uncharacterized protein n=2 Tax=Phyllosticta TaxID=121621 RepID=A0ABR1MMM2_9PEZI